MTTEEKRMSRHKKSYHIINNDLIYITIFRVDWCNY